MVTASGRGRIPRFGEAGAWLALAVGMWIYSFRFDGEFPAYLWGPVSWPRAVLAAIVVLALVQLVVRTVVERRTGSEPVAADGDPDGRDDARHDMRGSGDGDGAESTVAGGGAPPDAPDVPDAPDAPGAAYSGLDARLRIVATFTLPLLYLVALPRTGYFVTTPLFLVAYMLAFRERNLKYMLATTAGLYAGSLAIFSKLLFVPLPTGNWPGFYDFSNWLLEILHAI